MRSKIFIICLVVLNILLLYKVFQYSNKSSIYKNVSIIDFKEPFFNSFLTNGKSIVDLDLKDLRGEIIKLKNFIGNKKSLILVYTDVSCNACIDSLIENCNLLINKSKGKNTIIGIAYSKDLNYLRRFTRINKIQFSFLLDDSSKFVKSIPLKTLPVILMVDENHLIINSYYINIKVKDINSTFFEAASVFLNS